MRRGKLLSILSWLSLAALTLLGWAWATSFTIELIAVHSAGGRTAGVAVRGGDFVWIDVDVRGYAYTLPPGWSVAADGRYSVLSTPAPAVRGRVAVDGRLPLAACLAVPVGAAIASAARRRRSARPAFEVIPSGK